MHPSKHFQEKVTSRKTFNHFLITQLRVPNCCHFTHKMCPHSGPTSNLISIKSAGTQKDGKSRENSEKVDEKILEGNDKIIRGEK